MKLNDTEQRPVYLIQERSFWTKPPICYGRFPSHNDALMALHRISGNSWDYAFKWEGFAIHDAETGNAEAGSSQPANIIYRTKGDT